MGLVLPSETISEQKEYCPSVAKFLIYSISLMKMMRVV